MRGVRLQVEAPEDVDVPKHLLAPEAVEQLVAERQPRFIPLERYGPGADAVRDRYCTKAALERHEDQLLPDGQRASGGHGTHGGGWRSSNGRAGPGPLRHRRCKHWYQNFERVWHCWRLEERSGMCKYKIWVDIHLESFRT